MVETITRLYHCHKIHKHVTVYEEYEVSDSGRRLLRCSCPYHQYTEMKPHCDGYNDHGFQCGYAKNQ